MKAQAAIMDALFFMFICASAAALLYFTAGLYGSNSNQQMTALYNYDYLKTAMLSLHYAKDDNGEWFFNELGKKLGSSDPVTSVEDYLSGGASNVWSNITASAPAKKTALHFVSETGTDFYCYNDVLGSVQCDNSFTKGSVVYAYSVKLEDSNGDDWTVGLELHY